MFSSPGTQSTAFALRHLDRKCHLRSASAPEHNLVRAFVQRHASCCRRELQVCHRGDIEAHCGAGSRRDGADAIEVDETLEDEPPIAGQFADDQPAEISDNQDEQESEKKEKKTRREITLEKMKARLSKKKDDYRDDDGNSRDARVSSAL